MNPDTVAAIFFGGLFLFGITSMVCVSFSKDSRPELIKAITEAAKEIEDDCPVKKELEELKARVEKLEEIRK